jgi:hypothetical protein
MGIDDIAGVVVLGLSARVKDSLPGRRSALVGQLSYRTTCANRRLRALRVTVIPRVALLANARCQALGLL